jgi:hypothetical protein
MGQLRACRLLPGPVTHPLQVSGAELLLHMFSMLLACLISRCCRRRRCCCCCCCRDIISLSRLETSSLPLPASAANLAAWPGVMPQQQQQQQAHREQPELSRLRHAAPVGSPAVASSGSKVAVLTNQPLAAIAQPAAAAVGSHTAGVRMSPAVQCFQQASRHHLQQPQQQLASAAAAAAAAAPQPEVSQGVAAAVGDTGAVGAFDGIGAAAAVVASRAKSLSSMAGGVHSTPSPVTGHALRQAAGSFRGPSPLGPVHGSRSSRQAAGLSALLAPGRQQQQQQQQSHGTPVMTAPPVFAGAPGSGASSAAGGPAGSGSARRSMQLLPGSFRLAGANQSPGEGAGWLLGNWLLMHLLMRCSVVPLAYVLQVKAMSRNPILALYSAFLTTGCVCSAPSLSTACTVIHCNSCEPRQPSCTCPAGNQPPAGPRTRQPARAVSRAEV